MMGVSGWWALQARMTSMPSRPGRLKSVTTRSQRLFSTSWHPLIPS